MSQEPDGEHEECDPDRADVRRYLKGVICKVGQVAKNEEQGRHSDKETSENHHKGFRYGDPLLGWSVVPPCTHVLSYNDDSDEQTKPGPFVNVL